MKLRKFIFLMISMFFSSHSTSSEKLPLVTAEKFLEYKRKNGHFEQFTVPEVVLICYQHSTLTYLLNQYPQIRPAKSLSNFYLFKDEKVGILGGWGIGAPGLAFKMEELVALGVKKFIAVGTAGTLMNSHHIGDFIFASKALAEDGVAHHYLRGEAFANLDEEMLSHWNNFTKKQSLPTFCNALAWSFSAMFKESSEDIIRVTELGCDIVEM